MTEISPSLDSELKLTTTDTAPTDEAESTALAVVPAKSRSKFKLSPLLFVILGLFIVAGLAATAWFFLPQSTSNPFSLPSETATITNDPAATAPAQLASATTNPHCLSGNIIGTMQTWDKCDEHSTPATTKFLALGCLVDERDGKAYEIRKFADGKCWMVDNLRFGGTTDACAGKTDFAGSDFAPDRFGANTYGDCLDPSVTESSVCVSDAVTCGYLYNWSAAIQASASATPTAAVTGLCPAGWHLPSGGNAGEFALLHRAAGAQAAFWQPTGSWRGAFASFSRESGALKNTPTASGGYYWSSTQFDGASAETLRIDPEQVGFAGAANANDKTYGQAIRCVSD